MGIPVLRVNSFLGHRESVYSLQGAGEGGVFFSCAGDGMVVRWDVNRPDLGECVAQLPNSVYAIHHSAAEGWLAAGHNYDGVHILQWQEKREVTSVAISKAAIFDLNSYGSRLFVADGSGTLTVLDTTSWATLARIQASSQSVRCIAINAARGHLAAGYSDNCIRVFDLDTFAVIREWAAHDNSVFCLQYLNADRLVSGSRDARLKYWDAGANYALLSTTNAHLFAINHLACSPDGKHFVTCSLDKTVKLWNAADARLLKVIDHARHNGHRSSVNKALWMKDNQPLLTASDDRSIAAWHIQLVNDPPA